MTDHTIFHFTPASNVPKIIAAGGIHPDNVMFTQPEKYTDCASADIKTARRTKAVPVHPYGYVGDYVPFYYAPRSPMMSAISKGQVPGYDDSHGLVYIASSVAQVDAADLPWVCTDGNARAGITHFYNTREELEERTDWQIMREKYWRNTDEDGDRRRRRAAEFLVYNFFPLSLVTGIATHNQGVLNSIKACIPEGIITAIKPDFYL